MALSTQNFYMVFGGTSWGWQAIPQNYMSYDYGAAHTLGAPVRSQYSVYFLQSVPAITKTDPLAPARLDNPSLSHRST